MYENILSIEFFPAFADEVTEVPVDSVLVGPQLGRRGEGVSTSATDPCCHFRTVGFLEC